MTSKEFSILDSLAIDICKLLSWELGEHFAKEICHKKLTLKATALLGVDPLLKKRSFSRYTSEQQSLKNSRFTTFELNFDADDLNDLDDDELDIVG